MAKPADLSKTKGNRIGATMLFHTHSGEDDFGADADIYNRVYGIGFRAVQVQPNSQSDNWLTGLKQWANERTEDVNVHSIDFFVNVGVTPTCPVSDDPERRSRARDEFQKQLSKARVCGALSHFGPLTSGLLAGHYFWEPKHDDRAVEFLSWARGIAANANMPVELEPLNRFEAGVSTLAHMQALIARANAGGFLRLGPDTFHQHVGESHTVDAWKAHNGNFGLTGHLSDDGRAIIGDEQAISQTGVIPYLASGKCSIKTWNIEAFGFDVNPGIAGALCLRRLPMQTGLEVMRKSFELVVTEFSKY